MMNLACLRNTSQPGHNFPSALHNVPVLQDTKHTAACYAHADLSAFAHAISNFRNTLSTPICWLTPVCSSFNIPFKDHFLW